MTRLRELGNPRAIALLALLAALRGLAIVGLAEALANGIVAALAQEALNSAMAMGCAAVLLRAGATWAIRSYTVRAAAGAKEALRRDVATAVLSGAGGSAGSATAIGALGLDELDEYYRTVLPAIVTAATVPLLAGARILLADWVSAAIIVATVPLVPVFMVLVGMHSKRQADAAAGALQRLSDHLVELGRGLPVLVGLGRLEQQAESLDRLGREHRATTMRTLHTAFLSSLVLELISTLSVALIAVFVGVRLVDGSLPLAVGLVALILAPECFQPFRDLGSAFHASQNGLAAMRRARELVSARMPGRVLLRGGAVRVTGLTVRHPGRPAILSGLTAEFPRGSVTAIEGASGTGKSTLLGVLAGTVAPASGTVGGIDPVRVAWVPQHPRTVAGTVREELELYGDGIEPVLHRLGLEPLAGADPARLSPGELRRLAVARALLRVEAGAELLLLDEPTAHLDARSSALVVEAIAAVRGRVTIVIASHESEPLTLADRSLKLGKQGGSRAMATPGSEVVRPGAQLLPEPVAPAWPELVAVLRSVRWRMLAALALGAAAACFAAALTAVSGWLIVRAAEQPPIMYLLVAIVGVRFFGLGRAGLRYAERLVTHDAVLTSLVDLRARLWAGLAVRGLASRALATGASALDLIVGAADRVRDLVPRVLLPLGVAAVTAAAALVAVAALHTPAVPVLAVALMASAGGAIVAVLADRSAARAAVRSKSAITREFAGLAAAAADLAANGVADRELARLDAIDAAAGLDARRGAWALGLGDAIVVAACGLAAVLSLTTGATGPVVAVLALLPLALIEPLAGAVAAVQQAPALSEALRRVHSVTAASAPVTGGTPAPRIDALELRALSARWPEAAHPAFGPIDARVERGDWLLVEGPSASGKSTLLATLLGYLPPADGAVLVNGVDARAHAPATLRSRIAWCPQEAHLFASTIRGNLLLARSADDGELERVLRRVGLRHSLDTPVGSGGEQLSGGERQRLAVARALLAGGDIVLLDEPTAHLDAEAAAALLADLRTALADRIVVLVTHHADEARAGDSRVRLGGLAPSLVGTRTLLSRPRALSPDAALRGPVAGSGFGLVVTGPERTN